MEPNDLNVYFIMGSRNCREQHPLAVLEQALEAGITMFQLREKGIGALKGKELLEFAAQCQALCEAYQVPFIVNDYVELACKLGADGIHIGQDDQPLGEIRRNYHGIIGVSVHTMEEMEAAVAGGADYVGIGPIYKTRTKPDAQPARGVHFLRQMRKVYRGFPIVGIGGIAAGNSAEVREAGADGVAVISEICESKDIKRTIHSLMVR
ncbi:MAG: thiamine phosphate synthase [Bacillus sp. (in: firmicutes)]